MQQAAAAPGHDQRHQAGTGGRLSACRKFIFAVGGIPGPLTGIILTFYLSPFLLEVARVRCVVFLCPPRHDHTSRAACVVEGHA
eukprot:COSAG01_NODE_4612_length_4878_cov_15.581502_4_plen_84_part_00